jgi:Peptidase A4 family
VSVLKVKDGVITEKYNYAAILFRGKYNDSIRYYVFKDFIVEPGDLIIGYVWGDIGSSTGYGWLCNEGRNEWVSSQVTAASDVTFQGMSSEWIMAGQGPLETNPHPFPNYGATVFFNGFAGYKSGKVYTAATHAIRAPAALHLRGAVMA